LVVLWRRELHDLLKSDQGVDGVDGVGFGLHKCYRGKMQGRLRMDSGIGLPLCVPTTKRTTCLKRAIDTKPDLIVRLPLAKGPYPQWE
jgi:hypothetical protein